MPRINKTYTPTEFKNAVVVLEEVGAKNTLDLIKRLHERGWRVVYAGKVISEGGDRLVRQPKGY